jgi:hypothetical protein
MKQATDTQKPNAESGNPRCISRKQATAPTTIKHAPTIVNQRKRYARFAKKQATVFIKVCMAFG